MTLQYIEGFEGWSRPEPYYLQGAGGSFVVDIGGGRFGGTALANFTSGGGEVYQMLPGFYGFAGISSAGGSNYYWEEAAVLGFAYKFSPGGKPSTIVRWKDLHPENGIINQIELGKNANDILTISCNGSLLASGKTPMFTNRYYYIEWKCRLRSKVTTIPFFGSTGAPDHPAAHSNQVRLDGAFECEVPAGVAVGNVPSPGYYPVGAPRVSAYVARLGKFYLNYDQFQTTNHWDDFYICDQAGTDSNDFLGDISVNHLAVDLSGASPTAGNDSWALVTGPSKNNAVSEIPPDADASYIAARSAGARQTFFFPDMKANSLAIPGVSLTAIARKDDIGTKTLDAVFKVGSDVVITPSSLLGDLYKPMAFGAGRAPDGTAWTESAVNSLEAGVKLDA